MRDEDENNIELRSYPALETRNENDAKKKESVDYDDLLFDAGGFGRYQLVLFISTFPFYIFEAFAYFSQLFITQVSQNHWCWIPELENLTDIERRDLAIPSDDSPLGYSRCSSYDANWTEVLLNGLKPNGTWPLTSCKNGWEFNKTEIPYDTISSDLEWVCDKDSYPATAQSMFFVGSVFGGIIIGYIADRFGRLPALVLSNMVGFAGGVASTFATNFLQFTVCRFIFGMANDNMVIMVYLIVLEYVAPKYRAFVANLPFALFYAPVLIALPWLVLACGHWKTISLVTSVPIGLALLSPLFIPESPRWLLSKGRIDEVVKKVLNVAKTNKQNISPEKVEKFRAFAIVVEDNKESVTMFGLLKRPLLRRTYICMTLVYMSAILVFDALVRTIDQLQFDFFISFSLVSLTELPSLVISAFILDWVGRRRMMAITMSICCISSVLIAFVGGGIPSLVCAIVARFVINVGFGTSTQWSSEILPTPVRGIGTALIHIMGFVAMMLSPYIAYLGRYIYWFPMTLIGCIAAFCALLAQTLPETAGKVLPQTFDDGENLIRNQKIFGICRGESKNKEYDGQDNRGFTS